MPLPRVVDLQHRSVPTTTTVKRAVSKTPVPTVLLVSRESFDSASRFYERTFISTLSFSGNHYTVPEIWFSFERDTLYIPGSELCTGIHLFTWHMPRLSHGNLDAGGYHRVANLALPSSWMPEYNRSSGLSEWRPLVRLLGSFGGVKNLTIIITTHTRDSSDEDSDLILQDGLHNPYLCMSMFQRAKTRSRPLLCSEDFPRYSNVYDSKDRSGLEVERRTWNREVANPTSYESYRTSHNDPRDMRYWEMPNIEFKALITRADQTKFEAQKSEYLAMIQENVERHKNHTEGGCDCETPPVDNETSELAI